MGKVEVKAKVKKKKRNFSSGLLQNDLFENFDPRF